MDGWITQSGYDLSEAEFALLLQAFAHDGTPDRGLAVLQRMNRELMELSRDTLAAAAAFFRCALCWSLEPAELLPIALSSEH